jgi:hypothetical protein
VARAGLVYLLIALLLAACSEAPMSAASPTPAPTSSPTPAPTASPTPTPTEASWVTFVFVDTNISLSYPRGWDHKPSGDGDAFYGFNGESIDIFAVASSELPHDFTIDSWGLDLILFWTDQGTILSNVESTVGGVESRRVTLTVDRDGDGFFVISEAFIQGDLAYWLSWMSPVGNETEDTATFQRIVDSCRFTSSNPSPSAGMASPSPHPATPTASMVDWLVYRGHGIVISYPSDWKVNEIQGETSVEIGVPHGHPFLRVTDRGDAGPMTAKLLAAMHLMDIQDNLESKDARESPIALGGEDAVLIRYHNTGVTGIEYYSLLLTVVHDGAWMEVALYSKAGQEATSDALLQQFVTSFAFED